MKTNEIKDLIINRIDEGGSGNQWLYLTVIGDSDCCLLLSRREIDLVPEYNVGWTYYSDLLLFNPRELDGIHNFFLKELAKVFFQDEILVYFHGGVFVATESFTLLLRGSLRFYSEKGDDLVFELATIYQTKLNCNIQKSWLYNSDVFISKLKLINELNSVMKIVNCEIHGVSDMDFNMHENLEEVGMDVEISFKI